MRRYGLAPRIVGIARDCSNILLSNPSIPAICLWPAVDRVYSLSTPRRIASVTLLAAAVLPIPMAYRLFLFWVTLHEI
jgi:hypothetical protein